mgnify:CR=1 FL=1
MLYSLVVCLVVSALITQLAVFATTIFLHRSACHKALVLHPAVVWFFKASLWLTTGIVTKEWVAVHRKHHHFTDEEGDPHSPFCPHHATLTIGQVHGGTAVNILARECEVLWGYRELPDRPLTALGERRDVTLDISRQILQAAL